MRRNDRRLTPRQPVEQSRLAGIRRSSDGDHKTVSQPLAAPAVGERCCNFAAQLLRSKKRRTDEILGHIGLIGEIDPRFDQRQRFDDLPPPSLGLVPDQTLQLAKCLPALRRRFRGDQIREPLHFRQIEAPVGEGAAGELTGFRKPAALDRAERIEHGAQ